MKNNEEIKKEQYLKLLSHKAFKFGGNLYWRFREAFHKFSAPKRLSVRHVAYASQRMLKAHQKKLQDLKYLIKKLQKLESEYIDNIFSFDFMIIFHVLTYGCGDTKSAYKFIRFKKEFFHNMYNTVNNGDLNLSAMLQNFTKFEIFLLEYSRRYANEGKQDAWKTNHAKVFNDFKKTKPQGPSDNGAIDEG